jgi:hypothetical protein
MIHCLAARLFRRHVRKGAHDHAGHRAGVLMRIDGRRSPDWIGIHELRQAEVQDLHVPVASNHHVFGLQVAMDDARIVGGGERAGHLERHIDRIRGRQPAAGDARSQRFAIDELGGDEADAIRTADIVNREDVWMVER